jgi:AcrR family transcriptional regulator
VTEQEEAAGIPPPPWQRLPDRPARHRRDPISREAIVTAALKLLDAEGLDALSMRRIADELGTGAASLYWHVGSKDGLLDLVMDRLIGEVEVPDADAARWQEQIREAARAQRQTSLRHPYLVRLSIGRIPMGPHALRMSERMLAIFTAGGLPERLAVQGFLLLIATVNGFTLDETGVGGPEGAPRPPEQARAAGDATRAYLASLPPAQFPHLVSHARQFAETDATERFELLLDIYVDGLARHAAAARAPGPGPAAG